MTEFCLLRGTCAVSFNRFTSFVCLAIAWYKMRLTIFLEGFIPLIKNSNIYCKRMFFFGWRTQIEEKLYFNNA